MERHETKPITIEVNQWESLDPEVRQHLSDALAESGYVVVTPEALPKTQVISDEAPAALRRPRPAVSRPRPASAVDIIGVEKARELHESLANRAARANERATTRSRSLSKFKKGLRPRLR